MADFLEERLSDLIRYGSSWQDEFAVNTVRTSGGQEYRSLIHPYPVRVFDISYMLDNARLWSKLVNVYMRAHGTFAGFRARCFDEWSSNGQTGTPTMLDQPTIRVSAGIYQLVKRYGTDKAAGASGYAYRLIKKPVAGTLLVAKNGTVVSSGVTLDSTTGRITITPAPLEADTITAGFEFDYPVRFETVLPVGQDYPGWRPVEGVRLRELLNP